MAHTISDRRRRQRIRELAPELERDTARRSRQEILHAWRLVRLWNLRVRLGRKMTFFPTVAVAIAAKAPVLEVLCPGCRSIGSVDLRTLDLHPDAPISALIPKLSCRRCSPQPPLATLLALRAGAPTWRDAEWHSPSATSA